jgi:plasmid maintenance system antidote protein VapI
MTSVKTFGELLKSAASERNLTLTDVALQSEVHLPNLSKIATGKRPCGLAVAHRLADALELRGPERLLFLQAASASTNRKNVLLDRSHCDYPGELRDFVVNYISSEGIFPEHIQSVTTNVNDGTPHLRLRDGTHFALRIVRSRL